jgi:hypothetical protein
MFSHITSKIPTVIMLLIIDFEGIFNTEFIGICMVCLHTKFYMLNSNGLLDIVVKLKAKYRLHGAAILSCILKNIVSTIVALSSKICYLTTSELLIK